MGNSFIGEILHAVAVRYRVTGSGNLRTYLRSLDDIRNVQLVDIPMVPATNREPTILSNFEEQRVQLELETIEIDDIFLISRIIIFVKPVSTGYPIV